MIGYTVTVPTVQTRMSSRPMQDESGHASARPLSLFQLGWCTNGLPVPVDVISADQREIPEVAALCPISRLNQDSIIGFNAKYGMHY
jgi:hypothetical protein